MLEAGVIQNYGNHLLFPSFVCFSEGDKLNETLIIIIISNLYPGSSTHSKVVFREVLHPIEVEFGNVDFLGEGKTGEPGEKPLGAE